MASSTGSETASTAPGTAAQMMMATLISPGKASPSRQQRRAVGGSTEKLDSVTNRYETWLTNHSAANTWREKTASISSRAMRLADAPTMNTGMSVTLTQMSAKEIPPRRP